MSHKLFKWERGKDFLAKTHKFEKKKTVQVKVLLTKCNNLATTIWHIISQDGFVVHDLQSFGSKRLYDDSITILIKKGLIYLNGKKIHSAVRIVPLKGYAEFNGIAYDGSFSVMSYKNDVICVNDVDLEDYVISVLRTESWPGWPLEVNKVFAIACRSYVINQAMRSLKSKCPFDVKNTNAHQTYKGRHDCSILKEAVEQTKGIVLGFSGKPILAMFDSCCGGIIPANIDDFDFEKAPYLARKYACNYCKPCSLYSWRLDYEHHIFEKLLADQPKKLFPIRSIRVTKRDKAGLVQEVRINGNRLSTVFSGKKAYSLFADVKSFCFDVYRKEGKIIFDGRGFGHHIGLCQWGAREMVREGKDYKYILQFYYPGTRFMELT